jgi:anti-anti-sigma factor
MPAQPSPVPMTAAPSGAGPGSLPLALTATPAGSWTVLTARGELDFGTVHEVISECASHRRFGVTCFVLDLREVEFIDCRAVLALLQLRRSCAAASGDLRIVSSATFLRRLFLAAGVHDQLAVWQTVTGATQAA